MKNITVYTNTGCSKCAMLKRWLTMNELDYDELNIGENQEARNLLISKGLRSLPQVAIGDEIVSFKEYNELLELIK